MYNQIFFEGSKYFYNRQYHNIQTSQPTVSKIKLQVRTTLPTITFLALENQKNTDPFAQNRKLTPCKRGSDEAKN